MSSTDPAKTIKAKDLKAYFEESRGLERDLLAELIRSRRTAWRVAIAAGLTAVVSVGAIAGLTPLKEVSPPAVFRVDKTTGHLEEVTSLTSAAVSPGEAFDVAQLNRYVLACESYDWHTLQRDYEICGLLSSVPRQQEYRKKFDGPDALDKRIRDSARIRVDVASITPSDSGTAVVRFSRRQENIDGSKEPTEHLIATIAFTYVSAQMKAADRRENPLGFQVTSYRVDPEISSRKAN